MTASAAPVALVTGGSGFVGRALCTRLQQRGSTVHGVARRPAEGPWDALVTCDLSREELPEEAIESVDTVFHLAAKVHVRTAGPDDPEHEAVTVDGTRRVLTAARQAGVSRFVFMSSVKAAGEGGDIAVDEGFERPPLTAYGRAKRKAEELVLRSAGESGMHVVVLRPALIYGPGWKGNLLRMFRAVQSGRLLPPPETGNRRSMVHVSDVAVAAVLAAERPSAAGRVYLLGDGEPYSTRRVYEAMCHAWGRPVSRWQVPPSLLKVAARAGDVLGGHGRWNVPFDSDVLDRLVGSAWYDAGLARRELEWTPLLTLEKALPEIVAYDGAWPAPSVA